MLQEALKIIRRDAEITQCYWDKWDSHWHGELGASAAILNAGYNLDSFIHRSSVPLLQHVLRLSSSWLQLSAPSPRRSIYEYYKGRSRRWPAKAKLSPGSRGMQIVFPAPIIHQLWEAMLEFTFRNADPNLYVVQARQSGPLCCQ